MLVHGDTIAAGSTCRQQRLDRGDDAYADDHHLGGHDLAPG